MNEFLLAGQTANTEYYLSVMSRLREEIPQKRPELWATTILGFCITVMHRLTFYSFFV